MGVRKNPIVVGRILAFARCFTGKRGVGNCAVGRGNQPVLSRHIHDRKALLAVDNAVYGALAACGEIIDNGSRFFRRVIRKAYVYGQRSVLHGNRNQQLCAGILPLQNLHVLRVRLGRGGHKVVAVGPVALKACQTVGQLPLRRRRQIEHISVVRAGILAVPDVPKTDTSGILCVQLHFEGKLIVI